MKITKSTLKKIIKEEILKEMMDNNRLAQIRQIISDTEKGKKRQLKPYKQTITRNELEYIIQNKALDKFNFHGENFRGSDLSGLDLSGLDLDRADFSGANLEGTNLSGADLLHADFSGANLKNANLEGANLYEGNLQGAKAQGANLSNSNLLYCDLSGVDLTGANLTGASGSEVVLKNANLTNAILFDISMDAEEEDLDGIILKGAKYNDETFLVGFDPWRAGRHTIADSIVRDPKYGAVKVDNSTSDDNQ